MAATALGAASVLGYLDARLRLSSDLRVVFGATKAKIKLDRAQKQGESLSDSSGVTHQCKGLRS